MGREMMDEGYLSRIEHAAPFAGAAENDLCKLVAEVRALRAENDSVREQAARWNSHAATLEASRDRLRNGIVDATTRIMNYHTTRPELRDYLTSLLEEGEL
jgi:uncharacterized coiled-coil DUF342 family protein